MINLLPIDEKKRINTLYTVRFVAASLCLLSIGILISYTLLIPSFFLTRTKERLVGEERKLMETSQEFVEFDALRQTVSIVNDRIAIMDRTDSPLVYRDLITKLLLLKTPDVLMQSIVYSVNPDGQTIELRGQARNRNALVEFIQIIERDSEVDIVSAPVSNFVTPDNLAYTLQLRLATSDTKE